LAVVVTVAKGYDLGYIWKTQGRPAPGEPPAPDVQIERNALTSAMAGSGPTRPCSPWDLRYRAGKSRERHHPATGVS
jgi:hypothetical protein